MQNVSNNKIYLFLFIAALANMLFLDIWFMMNFKAISEAKKSEEQAITPPTQTLISDTISCPQSCLTAISDVTDSLTLTPSSKPFPTPRQSSGQAILPTLAQSNSNKTVLPTSSKQNGDSAKEYFIPLGAGSTTASTWTDVLGVKAEVDNTKYGKIKQVLFEASVHVPNADQIVDVRLYNETDNYIVGNSELSFPSGTTQNFRITAISLGQGSKVYKVQMRTQLQYQAVLDQSRIHITTY